MTKNLQEMDNAEFAQEACDVVHHLANNFLLYAAMTSRIARLGDKGKQTEAFLFHGISQAMEGLGNAAESIGMEPPELDWTAEIYNEMRRRAEIYNARFEKPVAQEPAK